MKRRLILCDLDGTLYDTGSVNLDSYRRALAEEGVVLEAGDFQKYGLGGHYRDFLPRLAPSLSRESIERVHQRKTELYPECLVWARENTGLFRRLEALREDCWLAIVTTASRACTSALLAHFGRTDFFDLIVCGEDVRRSKPDPEGFLTAMAHFGIEAANTTVYEDSPAGLAAARASGARVLKVTFPDLDSGPADPPTG
jgi:HAD superfamily hydrolase (TIGR01509 family)